MPEPKKMNPSKLPPVKPDLDRRAYDQMRFALYDHERVNLASLDAIDELECRMQSLEAVVEAVGDTLDKLLTAVEKLTEVLTLKAEAEDER